MLSLFCVVDGKPLSKCFKIDIVPTAYVDDLRDAIKAKYAHDFSDIDATNITLWRVSIPVATTDKKKPISLDEANPKDELLPTDDLSEVFDEAVPKKTIHIIVQLPAAAQLPFPKLTPNRHSSGSSSDSLPSDDFHADIKKIVARFLALGTPEREFLDKFVLGEGNLPFTTGLVSGLPRVRRRDGAEPADTRPSLLFFDLPGPSADDSPSKQLTSDAILELAEKCDSQRVPVFGVCGCGKTRGLIELLSRRWGFYFNASPNDLGSKDMLNLMDMIERPLKQPRYNNDELAKKITYLLFIARLLILQHCLEVPNSGQTFTCARWTLLQVCPHIFKDVFNTLFRRFLQLPWKAQLEDDLHTIAKDEFHATRACLVKYGVTPKFQEDTKLLVVLDEAQILGDNLPGSFKSKSDGKTDRPLLSPILHGFRSVGGETELSLITSGTGLSIYTLSWAWSSGLNLGCNPKDFPYMEFSRWTNQESVEAYIDHLRSLLKDDAAREALDSLLPLDAVEMMTKRLIGRFRPIVTAIESIIERGEPSAWRDVIEKVEAQLVSYAFKHLPGNLCSEFVRLQKKCLDNTSALKEYNMVMEVFGLFLLRRYSYGANSYIHDEAMPVLAENAFGRIKMIKGTARTVLDEPFVLKAAENYFWERDPSFVKTLKFWAQVTDNPQVHGLVWEYMMMGVFIETFKTQSLDSWPGNAFISKQYKALCGKTKIVGLGELDELGELDGLDGQDKLAKRVFQCGITHNDISLKDFMCAHVNNNSERVDGRPVPPFFFPNPYISGPDIVFYIRVNGNLFPVFVQLKLRETVTSTIAKSALDTVSVKCVKDHVDMEGLCAGCPTDKTYISMLIAYPAKVDASLEGYFDTNLEDHKQVPVEHSSTNPKNLKQMLAKLRGTKLKDFKQVVIKVDKRNFGIIFPQSHTKFLNMLKKQRKQHAEDDQDAVGFNKTNM